MNVSPFTLAHGPTETLGLDSEPVEYFYQLIPEAFFDTLAEQTNLYASQKQESRRAKGLRDLKWTDCSADEMKAYLAIHIFMGIVKLPNYRLYWSSDCDFNQSFVSNLMPRNRYEQLASNFHLNDSTHNVPYGHEDHDQLHKVRPIISMVQDTWPRNYSPNCNLVIDEAMIKFKVQTKRGQRNCAHCKRQGTLTKSGKPVQTTTCCPVCNVGLCKDCFEPYHN